MASERTSQLAGASAPLAPTHAALEAGVLENTAWPRPTLVPVPATRVAPWNNTDAGGFREVGTTYVLTSGVDRLSWRRKGLWSACPEDHIGRTVGVARRTGKGAGARIDVRPEWPWAEDEKNVEVYGPDDPGGRGTNDFRSMKEYIYFASSLLAGTESCGSPMATRTAEPPPRKAEMHHRRLLSRARAGLLSMVLVAPIAFCVQPSEGRTVYRFDLRGRGPKVSPTSLKLGTTKSVPGHQLGMNSYYFLRDGRPWYPVMGEIHYSRYPREYWAEALRKMKAGGINVIATYVFWNHHEPVEGQWKWSGNRDLRQFLQLCARQDLYAFVRVGPWSHGEARNGGHPDWLLKKNIKLRSTDPQYLAYAHKVYEQIYAQCRGLLFKDGGPMIGVQVENEMTNNPEYLRTLKQMAREIGFDVPFYTATGWMSVKFPDNELLPVWAAYADMPWDGVGREPVPPRKQFLFTGGLDLFDRGTQDAPGAGLDLDRLRSEHLLDRAVWLPDGYPYAMAELGGGLQINRSRRPVLAAKDTAAMAMVSVGKGANLLGYYMYHGGSQPVGLEERGHPRVSYDFQAPLGEFGYSRDSYHYLRALHLFVEDFVSELAPAFPVLSDRMPKDPRDASTLRSIVRASGGTGFVFWNNHHRGVAMRDLGPLQFVVETQGEKLVIPGKPVTVPRGAFGIWPFNLSLGGAVLKYSTTEPLCVIRGADKSSTYFFFASEGILPEYVFDSRTVSKVETQCGTVARQGTTTRISNLTAGTGCAMTLRLKGESVRVVTLTNEQSRQFWKATAAGEEHAFLTGADLQFDGDEVIADSIGAPGISLAVFPPLRLASTPLGTKTSANGVFARYDVSLRSKQVDVSTQAEGPHKWFASLPEDAMQGLADVLLSADWKGDVAELYLDKGQYLIADDFYSGEPWRVGLKRFAPGIFKSGVTLEITPLKRDARTFLEQWPAMRGEELADLNRIRAVPVYRAVFRASAR